MATIDDGLLAIPETNEGQVNISEPSNVPDVNYEPATREVQDNELVSTQITGLLNNESPYISSARTRAEEYANSRGLLNSTIAANAGEDAAIRNALPIAQQDATTYGKTASENMVAKNTALNTGAQIKGNLTNTEMQNVAAQERLETQGEIDTGKIAQQGEIDIGKIQAAGGIDLQKIEAQGEVDLANTLVKSQADMDVIDAQVSGNLKLNYTKDVNGILGSFDTATKEILADPEIAAGQKANIINQLKLQRDTSLAVITDIYSQMPDWEASWEILLPEPVTSEEEVETETEGILETAPVGTVRVPFTDDTNTR